MYSFPLFLTFSKKETVPFFMSFNDKYNLVAK